MPLYPSEQDLDLPTDTMAFDSYEEMPSNVQPNETAAQTTSSSGTVTPQTPATQPPSDQPSPAPQPAPTTSQTSTLPPSQPASTAVPSQQPIKQPESATQQSPQPPVPAATPAALPANQPAPALPPAVPVNPAPTMPVLQEPTPKPIAPTAPLIVGGPQPTGPHIQQQVVQQKTEEKPQPPQPTGIAAPSLPSSGAAPVSTPSAEQPKQTASPEQIAPPAPIKEAEQKAPQPTPPPTGLVPQPMAQPSAPMVSEQPVSEAPELLGIDTVNLTEPSGNWLYKRIWWEKAQDRYEKIKGLVDRTFDARMIFFNKRNELEHTVFDPFYIHSGLGRGELEEILSYLMKQMELAREKHGTLTEAERAFLAIMNKEKETLEQLRLDIEGIAKLDQAVDGALDKLMEQLNLVRNYERKAWENFKQIAQELSDAKAKELYYGMVTYEENIGAIYNYIKHEYAQYFDQLVKTAKDNVERIQSAIKLLKEKGIDFKKQAQELVKKASPQERERLEQERLELERQEQEEAERQNSWTGWITGFFSSAWHGITEFFGSIYDTVSGWFGGRASEESHEETAEPLKEQEPIKKEEEAVPSE